MTSEEYISLISSINCKRLDIGDCLFSAQRHAHGLSNAKKLVSLAVELVELVSIIEHDK